MLKKVVQRVTELRDARYRHFWTQRLVTRTGWREKVGARIAAARPPAPVLDETLAPERDRRNCSTGMSTTGAS